MNYPMALGCPSTCGWTYPPPGITYESMQCFLTDMERRLEPSEHQKSRNMKSHTVAQYYRPRRFTIRVPQSHARASYLLAFYVIETLLYDILHVIAEHRGLTKDPEHLATQLSHIALFGDNAKKFLYSVQNHAPGAENILEAMGRLHDDKNYDIPLAKALTYVALRRFIWISVWNPPGWQSCRS